MLFQITTKSIDCILICFGFPKFKNSNFQFGLVPVYYVFMYLLLLLAAVSVCIHHVVLCMNEDSSGSIASSPASSSVFSHNRSGWVGESTRCWLLLRSIVVSLVMLSLYLPTYSIFTVSSRLIVLAFLLIDIHSFHHHYPFAHNQHRHSHKTVVRMGEKVSFGERLDLRLPIMPSTSSGTDARPVLEAFLANPVLIIEQVWDEDKVTEVCA